MSPTDPSGRLAIVIPAWRARHFAAALDSLRNQTDRRFRLYIGDDGSPDDLRSIVDAHTAGLDVVYHRFPANLGGADLVGHWHRCIALTRGEPWLWLFSDDDIAGPGCVAAFHRQFEADIGGTRLLRFNLVIIDEHNEVVRQPMPHPPRESALDCLAAMLTARDRYWCAPDHLFARAAYEGAGGFVNFPKALHADLATWVLFAGDAPILTLPGEGIRFRRHPQGTSSGMMHNHLEEMLVSAAGFCGFAVKLARRAAPERAEAMRGFTFRYFYQVLTAMHFDLGSNWKMAGYCWKAARKSPPPYAGRLRHQALRVWLRMVPGVGRLVRWRYERTRARAGLPDLSL